jgi:hypothetical protein
MSSEFERIETILLETKRSIFTKTHWMPRFIIFNMSMVLMVGSVANSPEIIIKIASI